jgi:Raf kinase inhibitor-like YbhB/YbcL family protein
MLDNVAPLQIDREEARTAGIGRTFNPRFPRTAVCFRVMKFLLIAVTALGLAAIAHNTSRTTNVLTLRAPDFAADGGIPAQHTCDGADRSPALSWTGQPPGTRSLVLIVDDPDAPDPAKPQRTWVHWVLYDLPPSVTALDEGVASRALPTGTREGLNDWGAAGWRGPCPPVGRHRYFFKLSALDVVLPALSHPDKAAVERAMHGHVLAHSELIGRYQRPGK